MIVLVTGVGRFSLGEALVDALVEHPRVAEVIAIDRMASSRVHGLSGVRHISMDLDGLKKGDIAERITDSLTHNASGPISALIQTTGVFDRGPFGQLDDATRKRILGVNVAGRIEVLAGVAAFNGQALSDMVYVDVGALHAVRASGERALYVGTKAWGIQFCASLMAGEEVGRALYVAPGPIDTHMLHRNHWVTKAGGSEAIFERLVRQPSLYQQIFIEGDHQAIKRLSSDDEAQVDQWFDRYRMAREEAFGAADGVLAPQECANEIVATIMSDSCHSGVLVVRNKDGENVATQSYPFEGGQHCRNGL